MEAATLGDVLGYGGSPRPERAWRELVGAAARGDQRALHALYDRSHRPVYTLLLRLTSNTRASEELLLQAYVDAWDHAPRYGARATSVLAWLMNLARQRGLEHLRLARTAQPGERRLAALLDIDTPDFRDVYDARERTSALRMALGHLLPEERDAIEGTFFAARSATELAETAGQPAEAVRARLRSALRKLAESTAESGAFANDCGEAPRTAAFGLRALPRDETSAAEAHLLDCAPCRQELKAVRLLEERFAWWPTDVLRPPASLRDRVAQRIGAHSRRGPVAPLEPDWIEPDWAEVAPGIRCKILAFDEDRQVVSMLVRLAPGAAYPPHTHAGVEELHLLDGELWIDYRKLHPGDYNRAEPGTGDRHVWSDTGCTCVLVTSSRDTLT